ncbi:MAG: Ig-like domain-containing protein, partial [Patescibacteria group bacterium]
HTLSDDGVDLRIDDTEVIRNWTNHGDTEDTKEIKLTQGYHKVQLKWFQNWGGATIRFWWERLNDPPLLDIIEPKEAYILVNPQEVNDRSPKQYPLYVRSSDPDSGRDPEVTFVIRDSQNRQLLNTIVREPNSNGTSRTAPRFGDSYRYYAPELDFRSRDASRLRSAPGGLGIEIVKPGVYIFDISSKDNQGAVTAKSTRVTVNQAPQFTRVSSSNPIFTKKSTDTSTVTIEADVTDEDGISGVTIKKDNDTPVRAERVGSTDTYDTYRATFTLAVRDAAYIFSVSATDANPVKQETAENRQGISLTVRKENESPSIPRFSLPGVPSGQKQFWLPKDKGAFVVPVSNLTDPDDNISRVSLLVDGSEVDYKNGGDIRDGNLTLQWRDPTDGKHSVNVRVVDFGSPRSFTVDGTVQSAEWNDTPSALMPAFPGRKSTFEFGEDVPLRAAVRDADGIASVEFYEGGTRIGAGTAVGSVRHDFGWGGDKDPRSYTVRAIATDNRGAVAESADPYTFTINKPPIPKIETLTIKDRDSDGVVLSNLSTRKQKIVASIGFDRTAPTSATLKVELVPKNGQASSQNIVIGKDAKNATVTFADTPEGAYRINVTLTDKYGTASTGAIDFTIVKPNEPPVIDSWVIEGVKGTTTQVTRPDKYTLIATAYDPDPTQPTLTFRRNDSVFSATPTITSKTTPTGKSGYEYRFTLEARDKGTFNYTVQASDGKLSSDVTSPLSITMNNAIPTVTRIEPRRTLTTDPVVSVYADARDPDGGISDVTFAVYDSGNKRVFSAKSSTKDYAPLSFGRGGFDDRKRYYAPAPYRASVGGKQAFSRSPQDVGVLTFPGPGIYTLVITSRDNDGAYSQENRTTVTINDVPVITGFKVVEGAEVLTPVGSQRARITLEAQTRDTIGGIDTVTLYNERSERVADLSKTGDNVYRHTLDLDARTGDYQFFVDPKDVHGEVGRRTSVQVKITKSNTVKFFSSSTRVPGHQSGSYYVIPTEQVRFGFNDVFDNVREPVEFFIGNQKLQTQKVQDNPAVYEWKDPVYGTQEVFAKLPHASVNEQTSTARFTVYDVIQVRDEAATATSFAAPYIYSIKTKTPRNALVTVGGANGSVPISVIARSKGSKIRAMRVFERDKSGEG